MVLEVLRGNPFFHASEPPETKRIFNRQNRAPSRLLTKCDTCYFDINDYLRFIAENQHVRAVWMLRDPRDMAISKLRRGAPKSDGGDCVHQADDATPNGCVADIRKAHMMLRQAMYMEPGSAIVCRMEAVIGDPVRASKYLCGALGIDYDPSMPDFVPRMRVAQKRARYKTIDRGQVEMWRRWETVYDGWLCKRGFDMPGIFNSLQDVVDDWGYST